MLAGLSTLFAAPGDLDTSFGVGGQLVTAVGVSDSGANDVALQSDGKLVAVGYSRNGSNNDFAVVRYNADGTLDTAFGGTGKVVTDFGGTNDSANGVAVQSDGKIIVVGTVSTASTGLFALARFHPDGSLDTSFGVAGTGRVTTTIGFSSTATKAEGVKIQPDGKILVVGHAHTIDTQDFIVMRYHGDGTLDNGFGTGGVVSTRLESPHVHEDIALDLALNSDGKILVGGHRTGPLSGGYKVTVYNSDGSPDASFAANGALYLFGEPSGMNQVHCVAWQADGKILIGGINGGGAGQNFCLRRYSAAGIVDTTFGTSGVVVTPIGTAADVPYDMEVQSDGKIVVVGSSYNANTGFEDLAVVRYNEDGTLDTTFRGTGKATTSFPGGTSVATSLVIGSDGRIVLAGAAHDGTKNQFALARYLGEGSLSTTAPAHHSHTSDNTPKVAGRATAGFTVNVHVDGSVAGTTVADGNGDWSLDLTSPLADGVHTVAVTETDSFGSTGPLSNVVSFTVDTVPPDAPVIASPTAGELIVSSWPVISGTAEAGTTARVYFDDILGGSVVAGSSGQWSFTPSTALSNGLRVVKASATDRAGNTSVFSSAISFTSLAALFGGPGNPDASFGVDGRVVTPVGVDNAGANGVALQSDGKLVAVGYAHNGTNNDFCVVRYNADGTLDTSFNGTGVTTTDFGAGDVASGVVIQSDGKIIVVGTNTTTSEGRFALARYKTDGTLDASFGVGAVGRVTTSIGYPVTLTKAEGVTLQPDGKILVVGNAAPAGNPDFVVLRYHNDGTLDNGFGAGGLASTSNATGHGGAHGHNDYALDLALRADGKILVGGHSSGPLQAGYMVTVYNSDGSPDASFATGGKMYLDSEASGMNQVYSVAWQADGKILIGGINGGGSGRNFCLRRMSETGIADPTFGNSGVVVTAIGTAADAIYDMEVQSDGKIAVVGSSYNANTGFEDFAVVRYNANGSLDTTFRGTGKVTASFPGGSAVGRSVVIGPDGRMVIAGYAHDGTKNNFALARFFGTDQPPQVTTSGATGIVRSGAVLNGIANPNNLATTAHYEYGLTAAYGNVTPDLPLGNGYLDVPATSAIGGLTDNTLYHFRLVATNAAGTSYGDDATFTTAPNPPLAFTGDAANISATGATLVGTVLPNGRDTTAYFEFGLSTAYGAQTSSQIIPAAGTLENVFSTLTDLVPGATYHFRLVAINAGSPIPITGVDKTFVAQAPPPVVAISGALPLSTSSVSLSGTVNPNGAGTEVFFDFGTSAGSFTQSVNAAPPTVSGALSVPVSGTLTGLSQGVTYYYRLRAVSPGGTTVSTTLAFKLDLLLGLTSVFPAVPPSSEGFLTVNLTPAGILHGWRFVGEQQWRPSGLPVAGLTTSNREIEFRPVPGYIQPQPEPVSIVSGEAVLPFNFEYISSGATGSGGLVITLKPDNLTTGTGRAQWRLLGENDTQWRDSDMPLNGLIPGSYLVECKPVTGRATPPGVNVTVVNGQTAAATITYFLPDAATGTPPAVLSFENVSADTTKPYAHVGQIRSTVGSSTGFVVKPRVVATAAHVVWDDGTLASLPRLEWLFQRYRGTHEPEALIPRGHYTFDGYAAQRIADNSPGDSSPQSQHLDVAAIYFNQDAGRGGYSGFLASDLSNNEFLLSGANKMLVGYPVDGISATSQGRMHATAPFNVVFSHGYNHPTDGVRTFATSSIRSSGGNSGGPLCVQFEGGAYYPAAIYLGGDNQTIVRAIDSAVIELFNRAQTSSGGGGNQTGGGITHTSFSGVSNGSTGNVQVLIEPAEARAVVDNMGNQLARWRLGDSGSFRVSGAVRSSLSPALYTLNLTTIAGFQAPTPQPITVTAGQQTTITYTYASSQTPQQTWRQSYFGTTANSGDAADDTDYDHDGFTNAEEFAAGTNPTMAGDYFKADNPQRSGNTFSLSTTGKAGRTYVLECSTTMAPGSWSTVDSEGPLASDQAVTLTDAASPPGAAFYRIRVTGP